MKKLVMLLMFAFIIFFIIFRPDSASEVFASLGGGIKGIAARFGEFFTNLAT